MEIKIPFLGDGIESANVISVLITEGESIDAEQILVELETDKATAPVPAPSSGVIETILIKEGDVVKQGSPVATLKSADGSVAKEEKAAPAAAAVPAAPTLASKPPQANQALSPLSYQAQAGKIPPTMPGIEKLAKQIGLDLSRIMPTGPSGRLTWDDLRAHIATLQAIAFSKTASSTEPEKKVIKALDLAGVGQVSRKAMTSLQQKVAENMQHCWESIPHVSQFEQTDITDLMALRKKYNENYKKKEARLTVTVFIVQALVDALKKHPIFNASYDEATKEIVYKESIHIGVAVDTENGLVVPVIKDVDKKDLLSISQELESLAGKARDRKLALSDIQGAGFTVSNLGSLGVGAFTPIINHPQVAILGVGLGEMLPKYNKEKQLEPRLTMPLALSYDHGLINGADAARFIKDLSIGITGFEESVIKQAL